MTADDTHSADDVRPPASQRFAGETADEVPDFQKHISPLLGRLGCNGRACHGSFQGRGDFRLSLFGYDFQADHDALLEENTGRVDPDDVEESLILAKPIDAELHEGGKRMDRGSWQYNVLRNWIAAGARFSKAEVQLLEQLEVTPKEILFSDANQQTQLQVIAHWADGTREDVTELCRFSSNDDAIASIDETGRVASGETGDTHVVVSYDNAVVPIAVIRPIAAPRVAHIESYDQPIDRLVEQKLAKLGVVASGTCTDADFIRRASMDLTGTLPSSDRVRQFLGDRSSDKRERLVNELLESPAYAAWWATRFSDWTGNNEAELNNTLPVRNVASKLWYEWLRERLAKGVPYDEIIEGIVVANSRQEGEDYVAYCEQMSEACRPGGEKSFAQRDGMPLYWARRNFRLPEDRAIGFAYTFLGVRIECAQCHKHPFDQWAKSDFDDFAKLFTSVNSNQNAISRDAREQRQQILKELGTSDKLRGNDLRRRLAESLSDGKTVPFPELVVDPSNVLRKAKNDAAKSKKKGKNPELRIPTGKILGEADEVELDEDPRVSLMRWLRSKDNPYFAKAIVNRVWANYFGIGIVNPTDDMNLANPPSNAPLLDYLAETFIEQGFDLKWLHREIVLSETYQRSTETNETNLRDKRNFSRHVPRRYPSEVVHDAVLLATLSDSAAQQTRQTLAGMTITDALTIYGDGRNSTFALQVFGRSERETNCDCDRSDSPSLLQSVYLKNDIDVHRRLADRKGWVTQVNSALGLDPKKPGDSTSEAERKMDRMRSVLASRIEEYNKLPEDRRPQGLRKLQGLYAGFEKRFDQAGESLPPLMELINKPELLLSARDEPQLESNDQASKLSVDKVIEEAYLRTLSRFPTESELSTSVAYYNDAADKGDAIESLMWALLNTKEFILSH